MAGLKPAKTGMAWMMKGDTGLYRTGHQGREVQQGTGGTFFTWKYMLGGTFVSYTNQVHQIECLSASPSLVYLTTKALVTEVTTGSVL